MERLVNGNLVRWRNWFLPGHCTLCAGTTRDPGVLCAACANALPRNTPACPVCANALPPSAEDDQPCGACQQKPPAFDEARALYQYSTPVATLIQQVKYGGQLALARELGERLGELISGDTATLPDWLLPVPLHANRLRRRGYNQALELARPLSRRLGIALEPRLATRVRATAPQQELDRRERARNLRGAFAVRQDLDGRNIAIIDDVMTSGATVASLARALKRAGAKRISVWVVARA